MKTSYPLCIAGILLSTALTPTAHASIMELLIEGTMLSREGGSSYGGGYSKLDLFDPGDPFEIKLTMDTSQLLSVPGANSSASRYTEAGSGPVIVGGSLRTRDIPGTFSLLGGPGFLANSGECFESPECINDLPEPQPGVDPTLRRDYEQVVIERTTGTPSETTFDWNYGASTPRGYDIGFDVPDPYLGVSLSLNALDASGASFKDLASNGVINYGGGGIDSGYLSVFSDEPAAYGKGLWRFNYSFDVSRIAFTPVSAVPEVETWVMLGLGGMIIGYRLRRQRRLTTAAQSA